MSKPDEDRRTSRQRPWEAAMDGFCALDLDNDEALASLVRNGPYREPDYLDDLPEAEPPPYAYSLAELPLQIYWLAQTVVENPVAVGVLGNVTYELLKAGLKKVRANAKPLKWRPRSYLREEAENFDRVCKDYARAAVIARCEQLGLRSPNPTRATRRVLDQRRRRPMDHRAAGTRDVQS